MENERSEIFETHLSAFRLLVSMTSFFMTANVTIIGFAVSNKSALLILLGGLFPLFILVSYLLLSRLYCAIIYSGMTVGCEGKEYGRNFFAVLLSLVGPDVYQELKQVLAISDPDQQLDRLQRIKNKFVPAFSRSILVSMSLAHFLASSALWYLSDWAYA